jgi:hypothetical protein
MNTQIKKVSPQKPNVAMLLIQPYPGGKFQTVPKSTFEKILDKILSRIDTLAYEVDFTSIQLCTEKFWEEEIDSSERKCAGKYIALMVSSGKLPLQPNGIDPSSKAKLYRRK